MKRLTYKPLIVIEDHKNNIIKLIQDNTTLCDDINIHCIIPYIGLELGPYCDMRNINMSHIIYDKVDLSYANFEGCDVTDSKFNNVVNSFNINLEGSNISKTQIYWLNHNNNMIPFKLYPKLYQPSGTGGWRRLRPDFYIRFNDDLMMI
jgi:hypothetical protein